MDRGASIKLSLIDGKIHADLNSSCGGMSPYEIGYLMGALIQSAQGVRDQMREAILSARPECGDEFDAGEGVSLDVAPQVIQYRSLVKEGT